MRIKRAPPLLCFFKSKSCCFPAPLVKLIPEQRRTKTQRISLPPPRLPFSPSQTSPMPARWLGTGRDPLLPLSSTPQPPASPPGPRARPGATARCWGLCVLNDMGGGGCGRWDEGNGARFSSKEKALSCLQTGRGEMVTPMSPGPGAAVWTSG